MNSSNTGILHFESLQRFETIVHFSTTRLGGCSPGAYDSFNLGYFSGDAKENVEKNREKLNEILRLNLEKFFVPYQTHGSEILLLEEDFLDIPADERILKLHGKDALLTSLKHVSIAVSTADCVPILLFAKDKNVIGAVHAGWRGTCQKILRKTIQMMIDHYHCDPSEIHAVIGPSIGPESFEVGEEVFLAFEKAGFEMATISYRHPVSGKYHINLWEANKLQIRALNVPENQIEIAGICTFSESDRFFSARKLGILSGRMLTGICRT